MNRILMSIIALGLLAFQGLPASATTIATSTAGSVTTLAVATTPTGTLDTGQSFGLKDEAFVLDSSSGHYSQVYTYIPFTTTGGGAFSASASDLHDTIPGDLQLKWMSLKLFTYTGTGFQFTQCAGGSPLCSLIDYGSGDPSTVSAVLAAGTQYLLQIGYGFCGCSGDQAGIQLTANIAATPLPPASLMFLTALMAVCGIGWTRRRAPVLRTSVG